VNTFDRNPTRGCSGPAVATPAGPIRTNAKAKQRMAFNSLMSLIKTILLSASFLPGKPDPYSLDDLSLRDTPDFVVMGPGFAGTTLCCVENREKTETGESPLVFVSMLGVWIYPAVPRMRQQLDPLRFSEARWFRSAVVSRLIARDSRAAFSNSLM